MYANAWGVRRNGELAFQLARQAADADRGWGYFCMGWLVYACKKAGMQTKKRKKLHKFIKREKRQRERGRERGRSSCVR